MGLAMKSSSPSVKRLLRLVVEHQEDQWVTVTHDDLVSWLDEIERLMENVGGFGE